MSRIGKLPIKVSSDIKVAIDNSTITFTKGNVVKKYDFGNKVKVLFENNELKVCEPESKTYEFEKFVGLHRSNLNNIIKGLKDNFKIVLEYNGVGYRANVVKDLLVLGLGYSHDIAVRIPENIQVVPEKPNLITMTSSDNIDLGRYAAFIKSLRETEPYKGKGVKYQGQTILRKEGKKK